MSTDITFFKSLEAQFKGAPLNGFGNDPDMTMDLSFQGAPFVVYPNQALRGSVAHQGSFFLTF